MGLQCYFTRFADLWQAGKEANMIHLYLLGFLIIILVAVIGLLGISLLANRIFEKQ